MKARRRTAQEKQKQGADCSSPPRGPLPAQKCCRLGHANGQGRASPDAGPVVPERCEHKRGEKSFFVLDATAFQLCLFLHSRAFLVNSIFVGRHTQKRGGETGENSAAAFANVFSAHCFGEAQEEAERTLSSPLPPPFPLFRLNCLCGKILQLCIALRVCGGQCTETNSGGLPAAFCEEREGGKE